MKQHIEDSQKKFRAFSNETLDDYHGERAFVYTESALETALTTLQQKHAEELEKAVLPRQVRVSLRNWSIQVRYL